MTQPFGASHEEWWQFDVELGLTADLLPVVSNPNAPISPDSRMKALGKTPSIYNGRGQAVGLPKWTEKITTGAQIEKWSKQHDYGICVQTRFARALDCDVPDVQLSSQISHAFCQALSLSGIQLPRRGRAGTGKVLLPFVLEGEWGKRSFTVKEWQDEAGATKRWIVEFLGNGQQFVAIGTHPDGTRYEWEGGLPRELPVITADRFERAWSAIYQQFGLAGSERRAGLSVGHGPELEDVDDDVADFLTENWPSFGERSGKLFVECPWKAGHSSDSGETEACWLRAGTRGRVRGHFSCRHASCSGRTDAEFLNAVGFVPAKKEDFDDLTVAAAVAGVVGGAGDLDPEILYRSLLAQEGSVRPGASPKLAEAGLPLPGFVRDKQGAIEAVIENVVTAMSSPRACGKQVRYDTFRGELMVADAGTDEWVTFEDADAVQFRVNLAAIRFKPVGKELMRDALMLVARGNRFDSAQLWLETVVPDWDGEPRIDSFYHRYFKTEDTPYTRACGRYVWSAHPGRILKPGCKADMVPILMGAQGLRKSSGIRAMSPAEEFFSEFALDVGDKDIARKMRGCLVGELAELQGLNSRAADAIRAWVVRQVEEWTPKYMENSQRFARRLIFHGTTNEEEFLADPTGERRWLPLKVLGLVDVDAIKRDCAQLWAEGRELFKRVGVDFADAERLAKAEHAKYRVTDAWEPQATRWLDEENLAGMSPRRSGTLRSAEMLTDCIGLLPGQIGTREKMRASRVLSACGMYQDRRRIAGFEHPQRVWLSSLDEDLR